MIYYIGHFNIEDLIYPHFTRAGTAGGACLYAAMGGYIWNRDISVISRIGSAYPREYLDTLEKLNIGLCLKVIEGETMSSVTEYLPGQDRSFKMKNCPAKLLELTPTAEDVEKADIAPGSFAHIGPMNLELLRDVAAVLKQRGCAFSVDTCDSFVREDQQGLITLLRDAELFLPSRSELMSFDSAGRTLLEQADWLSDAIGRPVAVKDSVRGSFVPQDGRYINVPAYTAANPVDLTGAGDSYCGAFIAKYSEGASLRQCAVYAGVSSSLAIEGCGALHYYGVSQAEKQKRLTYIKDKMEEE